jgi:MoaA/NifB/PqqE/SkfB family radical SAM enzyme
LKDLQRRYLDQPNEVSLETLTLCNARCTFCPYPTLERKGTRMPDELIASVVEQMAEFEQPFHFAPFKLNEPFLDPRLIPLLERVNRDVPNASLRIFTNGTPLTPEKVEEVARLKNVRHLWVSLNSHLKDEYEALMGLKFEIVTKRLDYLHSIDFPHDVMLSCVGFPNEDFRRYCFDRWPKFESMAIMRTSWLGYVTPQDSPIPNAGCSRWFELSIMADGKVSLCCMSSGENKGPEFVIGDVTSHSLLEIYNQPKLKGRREMLWSRKNIFPCSTCNYG